MFSKSEQNKTAQIYVCTKLSMLPEDSTQFFTPEYNEIASAGLNTGEEKHYFLEREKAEELLFKKGTNWCIYALEIPEQNIKNSGEKILINGYQVRPSDITEIIFHELSPYKSESPSASM